MMSSTGKFVWHELMTTDTEGAEAFYRNVVGWSARGSGMPGADYTVFTADGIDAGGMMKLPPAAPHPGWIGYVHTDDVDAAIARLIQAGGIIRRAAEDIPGIGRFAVVADPQGATFVLFRPSPEMTQPARPPGTMGRAGWHELHAAEWESAFAFYADQFGWTKDAAFDMGPMGTYQLFAAGDGPIGGMMTKTDAVPTPAWLFYFNVPDIDAASARVTTGGGHVLSGPMEVPGGAWIIQCRDPQGAMFALLQPPV